MKKFRIQLIVWFARARTFLSKHVIRWIGKFNGFDGDYYRGNLILNTKYMGDFTLVLYQCKEGGFHGHRFLTSMWESGAVDLPQSPRKREYAWALTNSWNGPPEPLTKTELLRLNADIKSNKPNAEQAAYIMKNEYPLPLTEDQLWIDDPMDGFHGMYGKGKRATLMGPEIHKEKNIIAIDILNSKERNTNDL